MIGIAKPEQPAAARSSLDQHPISAGTGRPIGHTVLDDVDISTGTQRLAASRSNLLVMREFANCYETFGRLATQLGRSTVRPEHWDEARAWYRKSADIWTEWQARGVGDPPSFPRKDAALREMAAAEAASRALAKPAPRLP